MRPHFTSLTITLLSALMASSCIYRSQVEDREFRTPEQFRAKTKAEAAAQKGLGRWWKLFEDPTLDKLVSNAFEQNLDLEISRARIAQARAQLMGATSGWFPSISGTADASKSQSAFNAPDALGGGVQTVTADVIQLSLSASYEIDVWGKVRYARKAAKHALEASVQDLRAAYVTVAATVADTYFLVVQQREQLRLLESTIENRKKQIDLVRQRYHAGVARPADLYQSEQLLSDARAQRADAAGNVKMAKNALAVLLGRYPGEVKSGRLERLPEAIRAMNPEVPGNLLLQRPDLRSAHQRLLAIDAQVGVALANHFPSISLGGSIGTRLDPTAMIWNMFANLTQPIFQGGRIRAEYKQKQAVLRENLAAYQKVLLNAVREVEDALVLGRAIAERIHWLEERVEALEGALRLSIDQYAQGLSPFLDVLASEQALLGSRSALIAGRRQLIAARISLARALGGSWMDDRIAEKPENRKERRDSRDGDKG